MSHVQKIAFVGNYLPRKCGIATFTQDLHCAVAASRSGVRTGVVAMNDAGRRYEYPAAVEVEIDDASVSDYANAAKSLNDKRFDVVSLQHEYGIFGGEAGGNILSLLDRLAMPVVSTLHTVLADPSEQQRAVLDSIIARSSRVVVMAQMGRELLRSVHDVPDAKIDVIAHGIPDFPFREPTRAKKALGFGDRKVILTFGLLSPSKGIEVVIEAMPAIIAACPDALYVVLGATHPNLVLEQGEAYRDSLLARVVALGLQNHVVFVNHFVDKPALLTYISACDVYVTPYLKATQMTSGTLAYSFGLGKAIVSTPYWHAKELLADGCGVLVPFGDSLAIGNEIAALMTDDVRRNAMRKRAYLASRTMTWDETAIAYLAAFDRAFKPVVHIAARHRNMQPGRPKPRPLPEIRLEHLLSMCDSTGVLQHAVHCIPDRAHGYCVDDNARALILACDLHDDGTSRIPAAQTAQFAAFIQHAWNPDTRRFRNFMGYDRRWLEDQGSEDSHGRTMWALGLCSHTDRSASRRLWASSLFAAALPVVDRFTSPRAWAFTLLGLDAFCLSQPQNDEAQVMRRSLASRLMALLAANERPGWHWFEDGLAYDNARLPQALLLTGSAVNDSNMTGAGLRTLRWLMRMQSSPTGHFRPVGSDGFSMRGRQQPMLFDQQPVEAAATIAACASAERLDRDPSWRLEAIKAFDWFVGSNDLNTPLVDVDTGSCRDGLHRDRVNENRGAESVLAYLQGLHDVRRLTEMHADIDARLLRSTVRATPGQQLLLRDSLKGTQLVTAHVLQSPSAAPQA